jgi:hypothetical protein
VLFTLGYLLLVGAARDLRACGLMEIAIALRLNIERRIALLIVSDSAMARKSHAKLSSSGAFELRPLIANTMNGAITIKIVRKWEWGEQSGETVLRFSRSS